MSEDGYARIERLGKYRVVAEIGRGGMARVFRAQDTGSGREVAVKALLPELAGQPAFVKRFRREIETLRALDHPGIVKILDVGEDAGIQYYVMEYMDGATVEKQFRLTGKFAVPFALKVTRAVAEALQYAHAKGVIHRDIKLANIMTDSGGHIKLADFGIAKEIDATRLTVTGGIVGTADYMSPEQAEGRRVTRKSDIYSLGVCLYQMLTGRLPFVGKTYMDVIRAHRFTLPEPPKTLNPALPMRVVRLVEMMMEKDPDKRLSSAQDVVSLIDGAGGSGRELTEDEIASAREMVRLALLPDYDWRRVAMKVFATAVLAGLAVLSAVGLYNRYFTTAADKYNRGMQELWEGNYDGAKSWFELVQNYHPGSPYAEQAQRRIDELLHNAIKKNKTPATEKKPPTAVELYEEAAKMLDTGQRKEAIRRLRRLSTDYAGTEGGRKAAQKLSELEGGGEPSLSGGNAVTGAEAKPGAVQGASDSLIQP